MTQAAIECCMTTPEFTLLMQGRTSGIPKTAIRILEINIKLNESIQDNEQLLIELQEERSL